MRALLLVLATGCVTPSNTFTCDVASECPGGTCEADGFCSFPDTACPSGSRYGDGAGAQSNECTAVTAVCGDGMVTGTEECEDDNTDDTDFCIDCKLATCGDGHVFANVEDCDDSNTVDGDACNANCLDCGAGSVTNPANNHCYTVVAGPLGWDAAGGMCATGRGYLATIDDAAENAFVLGLMATPGDHWIGLADFDDNNFFWEDSFPLGAFANWDAANGEPSQNGADIGVAMQADGLWDSQDRAITLPFLCERSPWTLEPTTHHAYLTFSGRAREDHAGAVAACAALPGAPHLVSITDAAEQTAVDAVTGATQAYLGLSDLTTEGTHVWDSGEPLGFVGWGANQPDAVNFDAEDCVVLNDDGTWATRVCGSFSIAFVCELDP